MIRIVYDVSAFTVHDGFGCVGDWDDGGEVHLFIDVCDEMHGTVRHSTAIQGLEKCNVLQLITWFIKSSFYSWLVCLSYIDHFYVRQYHVMTATQCSAMQPDVPTDLLTLALIDLQTYSLTHLTYLTHSLNHWLIVSLTNLFSYILTFLLTDSLPTLIHQFIYVLIFSLLMIICVAFNLCVMDCNSMPCKSMCTVLKCNTRQDYSI